MVDGHGPRRRDRRQTFAEVLSALTRALPKRHDLSLLRSTFEEMVRRLVPARTVHLRDATSRWRPREHHPDCEAVALEVPGNGGPTPGVLDATFDPGYRAGEYGAARQSSDARPERVHYMAMSISGSSGVLVQLVQVTVYLTRWPFLALLESIV